MVALLPAGLVKQKVAGKKMSDIAKHITELSAEKRQLLERYLKSAGLSLSSAMIIPQSRDTSKFPLSFAQQRLWFLDQLDPDSAVYNLPDSNYFKGPLNLDALERSLNEIVRRHEIMRTTFQTVKGVPVQVISEPQPLQLDVVDLTHLPAAERQGEAQRLANASALKPFDLTRGPLFRLQLLKLAETEHVLLLTMHHIISDGWSLGVWGRELSALYAAYSAGQSSPLGKLPIQYADFAVWQREWLQGEVLEKQLSYWREQLGGDLPALEFPTDRPRAARQTFRGAVEGLDLSGTTSRRLKEISRESGATLFMTLLAAFDVLLWRYSQQDEILIGTPIANRNRTETENLIGFFVNTLVIRTRLKAELSFRELLEQVRETTLGAFEHQDVPFEKLVEELQPERSLSHMPVFQVMFTLQDGGEIQMAGLELSWMETDSDVTKFDLSLFASETDAGMHVWFEYNTDLFDEPTIGRLLQHYRMLLEGIVANPEAKLAELPLLSEAERAQLWEWNETKSEYSREQCIQQLVEAQAARRPEALAVVYGAEQLSYGELNRRANQLAHYLRRRGVGAEVRVGVLLERSVELVVALLGILKAGGAYLPLDSSYPVQRLRYMLEDAGVRLVLTERGQAELETASEIVYLDESWERLEAQSEANPELVTNAENLAYVIYTSGSTGQPKGVEVTHRAINRLVSNTNYVQLGERERVAQVSNSSFDAATFEIWGALVHGGQLVGLTKETALSAAELARQIAEQQISVMFLTTALFNQIAQSEPGAFAPLRYLLFGGEASEAQAVRRVLAAGKPEHLLHVYGPTENTTFTSWYEVTEVAAGARTIPIGRAIANTEVWVLDQQGQVAPLGVVGELYIGGEGLARGYLARPALTAEQFVPHPYSAELGARLYRTGDLVRLLSDGNIEFLKRMDQQVKVRGFRVELGEIEAVLNQYWAISESVVVDRKDLAGGTRLIAYIVPEEGVEPTASEMSAFLREKLPSYMLPSAFVTLQELPLTPNGKVDRRVLPLPGDAAEANANFVAPRTALEETLAGIWRETLAVPQVGVESNFFDLGGHSLLATRVVSQIRERCGIELPLRVLFESPTVAALAGYLETQQPKKTELGRIFQMLENMEKISEDEVTALLSLTET
jgi:amino acid adenylation domain-containing protein